MSNGIKTKDSTKGGRSSDGASAVRSRVKQGIDKAKSSFKKLDEDDQEAPTGYAEDNAESIARDAAGDTIDTVKDAAKNIKDEVKRLKRKKKKVSSDCDDDDGEDVSNSGKKSDNGTGESGSSGTDSSGDGKNKDNGKDEKEKSGRKRKVKNEKDGKESHKKHDPEKAANGINDADYDEPAEKMNGRKPSSSADYNRSGQNDDFDYADGYSDNDPCDHEEKDSFNAEQSMQEAEQTHAQKDYSDRIKQTDRSAGRKNFKTPKRDIKTADSTVRTAERTAKTSEVTAKQTARTAEQTAKTAQKTAEATAKATEKAAEAARATAKATAETAKTAAKATASAVKAIITETEELIEAIAAGGWVAVLIILVIGMVALVVCSAFGVFASDDTIGGKPMSQIVSEINTEYYARIDNDVYAIDIGGYDAKQVFYSTDDDGEYPANNWNDVISVFAVLATTDAEDPMDAVILTDVSENYIRDVFYEMNSYDITTGSEYDEDNEMNVLDVYVTQHTMNFIEAKEHFHMSDSQAEILNDMMSPRYYSMFAELTGVDVYGDADVNAILTALPNSTAGNVVRAALSKLGAPYVRGSRGPNSFDCSGLAWWSINQADPALGTHFQGCAADQAHYCEHMTVDQSELQPGDLVFWHYNACSGCGRWNEIHHVGIYAGFGKVVEASSSNGRVVLRDLWESDSYELFMFARPY